MKLKLILLVLFLVCAFTSAQNRLAQANEEIERFLTTVDYDSDLAYSYLNTAYKTSFELKNDSLKARVFCNLGYYYCIKKNNIEATKNLLKSIEFSRKTKYYKMWSSSYNQLGLIALENDNHDKALQYYLQALQISEKQDIPVIKSRVLTNLGYLNYVLKDTLKALSYYNQNIQFAEKYSFYNQISFSCQMAASLYKQKDRKKAMDYFNKALSVVKKERNLVIELNLYINLSDFYLNDPKNNGLKEAYFYLKKAVEVQNQVADKSPEFYINFNFGGYYYNVNKFDLAIDYYNKALDLAKNNAYSSEKLGLYKSVSNCYVAKQDYQKALLFEKKYTKLNDSIFNVEKSKTFTEIQTKFEVDKKNLKIELLTKEKKIQSDRKRTILIVSIVLLISLLIVVLFLRNRIQTQKIISAKENEIHSQEIIRLEQEQEIKRIKGVIEGQDIERNRLAKEIHDGIGGSLAGIKLQLAQVNSNLNDERIDAILNQMTNAFNELRAISHNLSFNFLKNKNLEVLINQLKAEYQNRKEFEIDVFIYPENSLVSLTDRIKNQVYRIIQELMNNISKHANARQVTLNFTKHDGLLNIIVEDDGVGFDEINKTGIGLANIKERLSEINGTIFIESALEKGVTIIIDIPINE